MKNLTILGSTGSIGTQTLEIVRNNSELHVVSLAAGSNVTLMEQQIREFLPKTVAMWTQEAAKDLSIRVADINVKILYGMEGLTAICSDPETDIVVTAIVGMIGIKPTIAAIKAGKTIALANKETLVTAGHIIMPLAKENNVAILPVDSEHSAIFQCLHKEPKERLEKILLTASGGPFRHKTYEELKTMQLEDALKHPNWSMGKKVTIDSASLVNKGLEVMEAKWLFDVDLDKIQVVIQPQSIIHSMVQFVDGGIMAQLGVPDMKLPIQYALFYPDRKPMNERRVDFFSLGQITFEEPDTKTFRGLKLAYRAAEAGGSMPTVFNAANEKAVKLFINKKISFLEIAECIESCMDAHHVIAQPNVEEILATEAWSYEYIDRTFSM